MVEQSKSFCLNAILFDEFVVEDEDKDDDGVVIDDAMDCEDMDFAFLSFESPCFVFKVGDFITIIGLC